MINFNIKILEIEDAFKLVILHHEDERVVQQGVSLAVHAARSGDGSEFEVMFDFIKQYGDDYVRAVTSEEIEVFVLDAGAYYISVM